MVQTNRPQFEAPDAVVTLEGVSFIDGAKVELSSIGKQNWARFKTEPTTVAKAYKHEFQEFVNIHHPISGRWQTWHRMYWRLYANPVEEKMDSSQIDT